MDEEKKTTGTFGEHIKRERELRGVSLDEISAATRIATRFLQAIEDEKWDQLPGGIFNRSFVRAMAHHLGLDEESIVAEYALAMGDRPSVPVWTGRPPAVMPDRRWLAGILAVVFVIVLIVAGWFGVRRISAWHARRSARQAAEVAPPVAPPAASAVPAFGDSGTNSAGGAPAPSGIPNSSPAPANALAPLVLTLSAASATRVAVYADGQRVFEDDMKAGDNHTFMAQDKFQVSAGDAGSLLLELNGRKLAPIGPPGRPGQQTLTQDSLKGAPGGPH